MIIDCLTDWLNHFLLSGFIFLDIRHWLDEYYLKIKMISNLYGLILEVALNYVFLILIGRL